VQFDPFKKWSGFRDKNGVLLQVGDEVQFNRSADGYKAGTPHVVDAGRRAPFSGRICGFSGDSGVVIEISGVRYGNDMSDVEKNPEA